MNSETKGSAISKKGTPGLIDAVFRMLKSHSNNRRDIVVRLTFCLGNLVRSLSNDDIFVNTTNIPELLRLTVIHFDIFSFQAANCDESRICLAKTSSTTELLPELLSTYIMLLDDELHGKGVNRKSNNDIFGILISNS